MFSSFHIDPAYLRFVYDGLQSGATNKDNLNDLPNGLAGSYDDAIPPKSSVRDREKFLSFFTACSLFKKEVSPTLISDLLNWREQEVVDYLSVYSKWFNCPVSGRYLLYHERLRVFLLGKISPHKLDRANQSILSKCQMALERQEGDEWEVYALEHLPAHLLIPAMQHEQDSGLYKKLVYDTVFWSRQLEISKGFDWTKKMLNQAMGRAAKQNTDELIEWALNKVDLHHMEQNDAQRIIELVAENDVETALDRIESFGDNGKEGLQQKFIIYMLCLVELTFLDREDGQSRKDTIEKILKHFERKFKLIEYSMLDWNEIFPSHLIFKMIFIWSDLGLEYGFIFDLTKEWDSSWIINDKSIEESKCQILIDASNKIYDLRKRLDIWCNILSIETNENRFEKLLKCIKINIPKLKGTYHVSNTWNKLVEILIEAGKIQLAESIIISTNTDYPISFGLLNRHYRLKGNVKMATYYLNKIENKCVRIVELSKSAIHCFKSNYKLETEYFIDMCYQIYIELDKENRADVFESLFTALVKCNKHELVEYLAAHLDYDHEKNRAFGIMCSELSSYNLQLSISKINQISDSVYKAYCLYRISIRFQELGDSVESKKYFDLLINELESIPVYELDDWDQVINPRFVAINKMLIELSPENDNYFQQLISKIDNSDSTKSTIISCIKQYGNGYNKKIIKKYYFEYLKVKQTQLDAHSRFNIIYSISKKYLMNLKIEKSLSLLVHIYDENEFDNYLIKHLDYCFENKNYIDALKLTGYFKSIEKRVKYLLKISTIYFVEKNKTQSATILNEVSRLIDIYSGSNVIREKCLYDLSEEYLTQSEPVKSKEVIDKMNDEHFQKTHAKISYALYFLRARKVSIALNLIDDFSGRDKDMAFNYIISELCKFNISKAKELVSFIGVKDLKVDAYLKISEELIKNYSIYDVRQYLMQILALFNDMDKSKERDEYYGKLATYFGFINDIRYALDITNNITNVYIKTHAIISIFKSIIKRKNIREFRLYGSTVNKYVPVLYMDVFHLEIAVELAQAKYDTEYEEVISFLKVNGSTKVFERLTFKLIEVELYDKSYNLIANISDSYVKIEMYIKLLNNLKRDQFKDYDSLVYILYELLLKLEDNEYDKKSHVITNCALALLHLGYFSLAQDIAAQIPSYSVRINCFEKIGEYLLQIKGLSDSLKYVEKKFSLEFHFLIKNGILKAKYSTDINRKIMPLIVKEACNQDYLINSALENYALYELFFSSGSDFNRDKYVSRINIQWAIEIQNSININ